MENAIIMHNIDFICFFKNEYCIEIDLECCAEYNNLQAFLDYLDQTNDYRGCIKYSPYFNLLSLCQYLTTFTRDIKDSILYHAISNKNSIEIIKHILSCCANAKELLAGKTALLNAD